MRDVLPWLAVALAIVLSGCAASEPRSTTPLEAAHGAVEVGMPANGTLNPITAATRASCLRPAADRQVVQNDMSAYWQKRMAQFAAEPAPAEANSVVLVGDSITERFPSDLVSLAAQKRLVNRGIGGDKVGGGAYLGVLDRLDDIARTRPYTIVLMIGVNDILFANTPPDQLAACYAVLAEALAKLVPEPSRLILATTLPVERPGDKNAAIGAFNGRVRALARAKGYTLADGAQVFAIASIVAASAKAQRPLPISPYTADGLHLSRLGYGYLQVALAQAFQAAGLTDAKTTPQQQTR